MNERNLRFASISEAQATKIVVANHYLRRECPISWCWGIEVDGEVLGCLTIGKPNSYSVCAGVVGETLEDVRAKRGRNRDVYELNRLWLHDSLPRNSESKFIGWCLRALKKECPNIILVSYADSAQGHIGYVYQSTNWHYVGLSSEFEDITLEGYNDHRSVPKGKLYDPNAIRVRRSPKHRYVWTADPRDEVFIAWDILPYPKRPAGNEAGL